MKNEISFHCQKYLYLMFEQYFFEYEIKKKKYLFKLKI